MRFENQNGASFNRAHRTLRLSVSTIVLFSLVFAAHAFGQAASNEPARDSSDQMAVPSDLSTNQVQPEEVLPVSNQEAIAPRLAGTSQLSMLPSQGANFVPGAGRGPLHWGGIDLYPHLLYQLSYGNGLQSSPGQQENTFINQVSPGVSFRLGSHWTLDYTPTLRFYSDPRFKDGTDQSVNLSGGTAYQDWTFTLSQGYTASSQPLIETGAQTDQEIYSTALTAGYQMNSKVSLSLSVNQYFRFLNQSVGSELFTDTREWSAMGGLNYLVEPSLSVGIGAGLTYDNLAVGPDIFAEQLNANISWQVRNKLRFFLSGGLSDQQILGSHLPDLLSPIFSLSAQYQLFAQTTLSLTGGRAVTPSFFQGATTEATTINGAVSQRLVGRLYLGVSGAYGSTTYHATTTGPIGGNVGNYRTTSFQVSMTTSFLKRATASVFYQASYNSSGSALYNYTITQGGLTLGYHF